MQQGKSHDMLLGLDMLKRHQAKIDLKDNCLHIASSVVPFLSESELPESARLDAPPAETAKPSLAPASAAAPTVRPTPAAAQPTVTTAEEEKIKTLMDLGFPRDKALRALRQAQGNIEMAAGLLFSM